MADVFEFTGDKNVWGIEMQGPTTPSLGLYLCVGPAKPPGIEDISNIQTSFNFTGPPGTASALYYSLVFQLGKWMYNTERVDEWIEVSPTHREYYERTIAQKQMLEGVIRTGLTNAASSVADYELIQHDLRKYKEVLNYFKAKDEHSIKAMFIDQVDIHTGERISMRSIAPRWPTIIADFIRLTDDDKNPDDISKKYKLSRPEAVILATKNRLYIEWKKTFLEAAKSRYGLLTGLVNSRRKLMEEYREWLKPQIARFKSIKLGTATEFGRTQTFKSFADITGMSTFANHIRLHSWKFFRAVEFRRPPSETKAGKDFIFDPYDEYMRNRYVLDPNTGLARNYPWLREELKYCANCKKYLPADTVACPTCKVVSLEDRFKADEIVDKEIKPMWLQKKRGLRPDELYYVFHDIYVERYGTKLPVGELEDITFQLKTYVISQNVLLVKLLEIYCRDKELEKYIDEMLGMKFKEEEVTKAIAKEYPGFYGEQPKVSEWEQWVRGVKKPFASITGGLKKLQKPPSAPKTFMFVKPGPYEKEFADRIPKQYLTPSAQAQGALRDFLKEKAGM